MSRPSTTPLCGRFLSTSPLRGTTIISTRPASPGDISIHVPLAGDDPCPHPGNSISRHFYPRPPCGGRQTITVALVNTTKFLSTSPLRGTTVKICRVLFDAQIFLSTSPLRGTTVRLVQTALEHRISIHVPLAGDDGDAMTLWGMAQAISIHVPLAGDDSRCLRSPRR